MLRRRHSASWETIRAIVVTQGSAVTSSLSVLAHTTGRESFSGRGTDPHYMTFPGGEPDRLHDRGPGGRVQMYQRSIGGEAVDDGGRNARHHGGSFARLGRIDVRGVKPHGSAHGGGAGRCSMRSG